MDERARSAMQFAVTVVRFIEAEYPEHAGVREGEATSDVLAAMLARLDTQRTVALSDVCTFLRSATYTDPATGRDRHISGFRAAADELERHFGVA